MITPQYLNKGDVIGLVSPGNRNDPGVINNAVVVLENAGYRVRTSKHILDTYHRFAGTDEVRAADFQDMIDNNEVKLILATRGGYGSLRIIDKIDFTNLQKHPRWIAGFSDITVFHSHIYANFGVESVHSGMPWYFGEPGSENIAVETLLRVVSGQPVSYVIGHHRLNRQGNSEGVLVGGNLSILGSLIGSRSDFSTAGKILFIEEVGEFLYRLDRMMLTMKRAGKLDKLKGLIVGGLTEMSDNEIRFGLIAHEIIADAVAEYDYPVCFDFPAGHIHNNHALILGRTIDLSVGTTVKIDFQAE